MSQQDQAALQALEQQQAALSQHPLYAQLNSEADLHRFMQHHVFAVWDFMSLTKFLQGALTCTTLPWKPVEQTELARMVNEIILDEETDTHPAGGHVSHYELYLEAMRQAGLSTEEVESFVAQAPGNLEALPAYIKASQVPQAAKAFMGFTFDLLAKGKTHQVAAAFAFGRETLLPDVFREMVRQLEQEQPGKYNTFVYYLERHIEVDGGEHGDLAQAMIKHLCGDDATKWEEAIAAAKAALQARQALWDAILETITSAEAV